MFESLTLIQTHKIDRVPIVMVGKKYWSGLLEWMKSTMCEMESNINIADLDLIKLTDDPREAVEVISKFYEPDTSRIRPNF
jgi:predicted Rossmann-fold nucleotide-binding protein